MDVTKREGKAKKECERRDEKKTIFHPVLEHLKG